MKELFTYFFKGVDNHTPYVRWRRRRLANLIDSRLEITVNAEADEIDAIGVEYLINYMTRYQGSDFKVNRNAMILKEKLTEAKTECDNYTAAYNLAINRALEFINSHFNNSEVADNEVSEDVLEDNQTEETAAAPTAPATSPGFSADYENYIKFLTAKVDSMSSKLDRLSDIENNRYKKIRAVLGRMCTLETHYDIDIERCRNNINNAVNDMVAMIPGSDTADSETKTDYYKETWNSLYLEFKACTGLTVEKGTRSKLDTILSMQPEYVELFYAIVVRQRAAMRIKNLRATTIIDDNRITAELV